MSSIEPQAFREKFEQLHEELGRVFVGQPRVTRELLIAFFAQGHVLLEGVPGLGKTLLAKSFALALGLDFNRVQCTPDLMPGDVLGTQLVVERQGKKGFEFSKGPVFTEVLLADEVNRATPKTQSALLEAMAEHQVSIAGKTHRLPEPFFVIATQNPIEMEGTYPLPEAQLDRFLFRLVIDVPSEEELAQILRRTTTAEVPKINPVFSGDEGRSWLLQAQQLVREVLVADEVERHIVRLVAATHAKSESGNGIASRYLRYGASPRGAQAIMMGAKVSALIDGRVNVSYEDVHAVLQSSLNHRLILSFEAEAEKRTAFDVLNEITEPLCAAI